MWNFIRLELFYRASVDLSFNYCGNFDQNSRELINMGLLCNLMVQIRNESYGSWNLLWNLMVQIRNEHLINMMDTLG